MQNRIQYHTLRAGTHKRQKHKTRYTIMANFEELGVNETLRKAIEEMGFVMPMPVQEAVIPHLLDNSSDKQNDLIALAQTGQERLLHSDCRCCRG